MECPNATCTYSTFDYNNGESVINCPDCKVMWCKFCEKQLPDGDMVCVICTEGLRTVFQDVYDAIEEAAGIYFIFYFYYYHHHYYSFPSFIFILSYLFLYYYFIILFLFRLILIICIGTMCPNCKYRGQKYLEECTHITCNCGTLFCYCCGGSKDDVDTADPYSSDINRYFILFLILILLFRLMFYFFSCIFVSSLTYF